MKAAVDAAKPNATALAHVQVRTCQRRYGAILEDAYRQNPLAPSAQAKKRGPQKKSKPRNPVHCAEGASPDSEPHSGLCGPHSSPRARTPGMSAKVVRTVPCAEGSSPDPEPHSPLCGRVERVTIFSED